MTFREEFAILTADKEFSALKNAEMAHPLFACDRWERYCSACEKRGADKAFPTLVKGLSEGELQALREMRSVMSDRAEELDCALTMALLRGTDVDGEGAAELERERSFPRSAWSKRFMTGE